MSKLWVALTSDTEDNHPAYVPEWRECGSNYDIEESILRWEWTRYWLDLSDVFESQDVPITWLVRVDDGPVRETMLDLFRNEILELKSKGDEVGIHIHTFVWNPRSSGWVQTKDPKNETRIVRRSIEMFRRKLGYTPLSVRMGWHTMSNEIMTTLEAEGLAVDSSAIPGTSNSGKFGGRDNIYDWSRAPRLPYHPSRSDYQSPGDLKILELPLATPGANRINLFGTLVNKLSKIGNLAMFIPLAKRLDLTPNSYFYISPWWSLSVIIQIIKEYSEKPVGHANDFLIGSFHACDILDPRTGQKNLIFQRYISRIIEEILSLRRVEVKFMTLSEMAGSFVRDDP